MTTQSENLIDIFAKLFWTLVFSTAPAVLLGRDFGLSVGVGYFVIASALLAIHYDVQDLRKAAQSARDSQRDRAAA